MHPTPPPRRALTRRAAALAGLSATASLLAGCVATRNDALSLDFYTPPAVAPAPDDAPSVDAPSVRSPYRENWAPQRVVVPIARPWTQRSLRLGDWPARSQRDRARYPFPPATTVEPGENAAPLPVPVFFELANAAIELATAIPRTLVYASYAPTQQPLDPFERAPAWERPAPAEQPAPSTQDQR